MDMQKSGQFQAKMMILKAIWGSILMSLVIMGGVGYVFSSQGIVKGVVSGQTAEILVLAMGILAAIVAVGGFKADSFLAAQGRKDSSLASMSSDQRALALLPRYTQRCILRWALFETVGVIGLTCLLITGQSYQQHAAAFLLVSAVLVIMSAPSEKELRNMASGAQGF